MQEVQACTNRSHGGCSDYPKDEVPTEMFYKDPENPTGKPFKTCFDCRTYSKEYNKKLKEEKLEKKKETDTKDPNFRFCPHNTHKLASEYPCDKVPVELFLKDLIKISKGEYKKCRDCRNYVSTKRKNLVEKKKVSEDNDPNFGSCHNQSHKLDSIYPQNKVPIKDLLKNPDDPTSKVYQNCKECRDYSCNNVKNKHAERKQLSQLYRESKGDFLYCPSASHVLENVSEYPREKVPFLMFQRYPDDFDDLYDTCSDCRNHKAQQNNEYEKQKRLSAKEDEFYCDGCKHYKNLTDRAPNKDGSGSKNCFECKIKIREWGQGLREIFYTIIYEMFLKSGSSCQKCKSIFLVPSKGTQFAKILETYKIEDQRYVEYEGKVYLTSDFLVKFKELLEFRVIELDHLTEEEQRDRGLLQPDEKFEPKISGFSKFRSERPMRRESKKCQNVCCFCHIEETISRESGNYVRDDFEIVKKEYVDNLKRTSGCVTCGFKTELLRFLEMDHIDPSTKIDCIAAMVKSYKYNLEDVKEECKKCRVLCRHCHKIHTHKQLNIFS